MRRLAVAVEEVVPSLLLAASVVGVAAGVVGRYALNHPIPIVYELAVVALVWQVFLGATAAFRDNTHVRILVLVVWLPTRWRQRLAVVGEAATVVVLAGTAWLAWQFLGSGVRSLPMTGLSYRTVNAAVLVGLALGVLHSALRITTPRRRAEFVADFGRDLGASWDEPLIDRDG